MKRSAPMGGRTPRAKTVARTVNLRRPPRTPSGALVRRNVINAWTRTKIAQNIKRKSKTTGSPNSANSNAREMAVILRRLFTYNAPRGGAPVLYRGLALNSPNNVRTRENSPTSWTSSLSKAKIFAVVNKSKPGVILRLAPNNKVPWIHIKKNPRLRWSHLGEHILPPGNFKIKNVPNNNKIYNVTFEPNARYLRPWTFY